MELLVIEMRTVGCRLYTVDSVNCGIVESLKLADKEFEHEIKTVALVKLYELGKISSGKASNILGINRVDFLEKIGEYQVSMFHFPGENELNEDIANA